MPSTTFVAAALLAAAPSVMAGGLSIKNSCSSPIYYWIGQDGAQDQGPYTINAGDSTANQPYKGAAVVYKVSRSNVWGKEISQMEYSAGSKLFYDLSNLDGYPFLNDGVSVTPAQSSGCQAIACRPGQQECANAYDPGYIVNGVIVDDQTQACDPSVSLVMETCSGSNPGSGSVGSANTSGSSSDSDSGSDSDSPNNAPVSSANNPAPVETQQAVTSETSAQPVVASPTPAAPVAPQAQNQDPNVVIVTQWVTQQAQAQQATAAPNNGGGGTPLRVDSDGNIFIPRDAAAAPVPTTLVVEKRGPHGHAHGHAHGHRA